MRIMKSVATACVIAVIVVASLGACSSPSKGGSAKEQESFSATVQLKANLGPILSENDFPEGGQCYGGDLAENVDLHQKQLQVLNSKNEIVGAATIGTGTVHRGSDPWRGFTVKVSDITPGSKLYTVKIDDMVSDAFTADKLKTGDASFAVYKRQ